MERTKSTPCHAVDAGRLQPARWCRGPAHSLRHTFVRRLLNAEVTMENVAALLGHANLNTTRIYVTPSVEDLQAAEATAMPNSPTGIGSHVQLCFGGNSPGLMCNLCAIVRERPLRDDGFAHSLHMSHSPDSLSVVWMAPPMNWAAWQTGNSQSPLSRRGRLRR